MTTSQELFDQAQALRERADEIAKQAGDLWHNELRQKPLLERLIFAAHSRCPCGAGMAYDPADEGNGVFKGPSYWDCSAILLGTADPNVTHEARLPFAFYKVESENQPSAGGATTRPSG